MATFIKGDGIANAVGYRLLKKVGDDYSTVASKTFGKQDLVQLMGYIGLDGNAVATTLSGACFSKMVDITDFDENDNTTKAVNFTSVVGLTDYLSVAFYKKKDDYTSFVYGYNFSEIYEWWGGHFTADNIVATAKSHNANYVVFSTKENDSSFWYYTPNKINFRLEGYTDISAPGTYQLVVQAIAPTEGVDTDDDGKVDTIYTDSEYGGKNKAGEPLEPVIYTAKEVITFPIDISPLFTDTWRDGAIIVDSTKTNYGWHQANQTAYRCSDRYIDVTKYTKYFDGENVKLQITMPRATNSSHIQYGLAFYNGTTTSGSGVADVILGTCPMQYEATDYNNPRVETREITVPVGTKYIKTTWLTSNNELAVGTLFSAKLVSSESAV